MSKSARDCWAIFKKEFVDTAKATAKGLGFAAVVWAALGLLVGLIIGAIALGSNLYNHFGVIGPVGMCAALILLAVVIISTCMTWSQCRG